MTMGVSQLVYNGTMMAKESNQVSSMNNAMLTLALCYVLCKIPEGLLNNTAERFPLGTHSSQ
jgi:hypothetical protein